MDSLKEKIVQKLEQLPETALQEVLDFAEFLAWRKMKMQKKYHQQPSQIDDNSLVEYVGGVLVVKAESKSLESKEDLKTVVDDLREERIRKFTSW